MCNYNIKSKGLCEYGALVRIREKVCLREKVHNLQLGIFPSNYHTHMNPTGKHLTGYIYTI